MGGKNRLFVGFGFVAALIVATLAFVFQDVLFSNDAAMKSAVGKSVPDIYVYGGDEKNHPLREVVAANALAGRRTIVSLWATWCEPCRRELPVLKRSLPALRAANLDVILVNYDEGPPARALPEVNAWMIAQGLFLPTYFDFKQELMSALPVRGLPFAFGVGVDQKIAWLKTGEFRWDSPDPFVP